MKSVGSQDTFRTRGIVLSTLEVGLLGGAINHTTRPRPTTFMRSRGTRSSNLSVSERRQ